MFCKSIPYTVCSIFIFLFVLSTAHAQKSLDEKDIKVALRMIGHQLLLNSQDSTSRVMPIVREHEQFTLLFETEFEFEPSALAATIDSVATATHLVNSYIVEVVTCETKVVVYSYKKDELQQSDIIPCKGRVQPKACYEIVFTLVRRTQADTAFLPLVGEPGAEGRSGKAYLYYGALVLLLLVMGGWFYYLRKRKTAVAKEADLIPLGAYRFDWRNTALRIDQQKIELTAKEADLLLLLYNTANTTVEREVILNKVWGDQGDYVGRTLDVFISKLRKKLEADTSLKIANIRGVGYKLVM